MCLTQKYRECLMYILYRDGHFNWGHHGLARMVVGFTTTFAIIAYHH
jgi:hypothetical protein